MAFGGLDLFFKGLDGLIGAPRTSKDPIRGGPPSLLNTMRADHCAQPDARLGFRTSNGMEDVTPELEWEFVVVTPAGTRAVIFGTHQFRNYTRFPVPRGAGSEA